MNIAINYRDNLPVYISDRTYCPINRLINYNELTLDKIKIHTVYL